MRKLPVFVLAAAAALTVAGVPMTAQAATTCQSAGVNSFTTSCNGQNIESILNQLGCFNGNSCLADLNSCLNGTKGAADTSCSGNKSTSTCPNTSNTCGARQWRSCLGWR